MKQFRADLHCHSTCSDGTLTPFEILDLAKEIGLSGLSITDHDTTSAYTQPFLSKAAELGLQMIPGVEISSIHRNTSVHILAYNYDLQDEAFKNFISEAQGKRNDRNHKILEKLKELGMPIEYEELVAFASNDDTFNHKSLGRPHIALLMIKKGYVPHFQQAFDVYLKDGGKAFAPTLSRTAPEVIKEIHRAKGKAIIAHPGIYKNRHVVQDLLSMEFDGLEGYYSRVAPEQEKRWIDIAYNKGWLVTGGSDFHGSVKAHIPLGCSWVNEETFKKILER